MKKRKLLIVLFVLCVLSLSAFQVMTPDPDLAKKEDKINQLFATNTKTISYDNTIGDDETGSLIDLIPNNNIENTDSSLDKESIKKQINTIINLLTDREHDIIKMYFGINCESLTLYEIANKFDLTHERARQLKNGAIDKLKTIYLHKIKKIINE